MENSPGKTYRATLNRGVREFQRHCMIQSENCELEWNVETFKDFFDEKIWKDLLNLNAFSNTYPTNRSYERPPSTFSAEQLATFRENMADLTLDPQFGLFASVFLDSYEMVFLTEGKMEAGVDGSFWEVYKQTIPLRWIESTEKKTAVYEVWRRYPVADDYILCEVVYHHKLKEEVKKKRFVTMKIDKHITEEHYFGIRTKEQKLHYQNLANEYLVKYRDREQFPVRVDSEHVFVLHPNKLPHNLTPGMLPGLCTSREPKPLILSAAYSGPITQALEGEKTEFREHSRVDETPDSAKDIPTLYPSGYWRIITAPGMAGSVVREALVRTISKIHKCKTVEGVPSYFTKTFSREVVNERKQVKRREEGRPTNKVGELAELLPDETSTLNGSSPEEALKYTNKNKQYILEHLGDSINDIAKHLGVSRQMVGRYKIAIQRDYWDHLERDKLNWRSYEMEYIRKLIYKKPLYEYPSPKPPKKKK